MLTPPTKIISKNMTEFDHKKKSQQGQQVNLVQL